MAASIAHEINNPLEGLLNLIYLARGCADDPMQVRSYLETAEGELVRVSHIARQTLGYYRENGSFLSSSILTRVVHDVLRIYRPRLETNGITIHIHLDELPWLEIKRGEITQVLSNLVANASYAMSSGGELTIIIRPTPCLPMTPRTSCWKSATPAAESHRSTSLASSSPSSPRARSSAPESGSGLHASLSKATARLHRSRQQHRPDQARNHNVRFYLPMHPESRRYLDSTEAAQALYLLLTP